MIPQNKSRRLHRELLRFILFSCFCISFSIFLLPPESAFDETSIIQDQTKKDIQTLEPGKAIERQLAGGESHLYQIHLDAGQFLQVIAEHESIGVILKLMTPEGQILAEKQSGFRETDTTQILIVGEVYGIYKLMVQPKIKEGIAGKYRVKIEALREATDKEKIRFEAQKINLDAEKLFKQGTGESLNQSLEKYKEALSLWQEAVDSSGYAQTLYRIGYLYFQMFNDTEKTLEYYNQSLSIWQKIGNKFEEAEVLGRMGFVLFSVRENEKALDYLEKALEIKKALADRLGEATMLMRIGNVFNVLREKQKTIDYYDQSLKCFKELGFQDGEAATLQNLGNLYFSFGENNEALDCYKGSLKIYASKGDLIREANSNKNIGDIFYKFGQYQTALNHYRQAQQKYKITGIKHLEASTLHDIGIVFHSTGDYQNALDYYENSNNMLSDVKYRQTRVNILNSISQAYIDLCDTEKAIIYLNQTLQLARELKNQREEASALSSFGLLYRLLGENEKSIEYFEQALQIRQAIGDIWMEAYVLTNIGRGYVSLGEFQKAFDYYQKALPLSQKIGDKRGESYILFNTAIVEKERSNLQDALENIKSSINIIESLRTEVTDLSLRTSFFASIRDYYEFYIDLLMEMHRSYPMENYNVLAFETNECAHGRNLLDILVEAQINIQQGISPELMERERNLKSLLNTKEQYRINLGKKAGTEKETEELEKEIRDILRQYQNVQTQIRITNPRYAALTQPQPLKLNEIQQKILDDDTILLEYALGEYSSYVWAVTKNSLSSYILAKSTMIDSLAKLYYNHLTARNTIIANESNNQKRKRIAQSDSALYQVAAALSNVLLKPVINLLNFKRVLVVPENALQYVPFEALPIPVSDISVTPERQIPLAERYEIISIPSASVLPLLRNDKNDSIQPPKLISVLADPVFSADDPRVKQLKMITEQNIEPQENIEQEINLSERFFTRSIQESGIGTNHFELSRLPFSRQEAEGIIALVHSKNCMKALDFNANYKTATNPELSNYRIVHFATHGLLNSTHPELTGLVLSLVDKEGNPQNGFLRLHDIYNLNLNADLVVLSACQTALGKNIKGEGLVGLTRGFMYAGAPRVVASLWKVDDEATAELMKRFYKYLLGEEQLPAAAALRKAQISIMNEKRWQSPYYWAGFVLQGDWK